MGDVIGSSPEIDVLLAGDVCYDPFVTARLLNWFDGCVARGINVLLADPGRGFVRREGLEPVAEYAVPFEGDPSGALRRPTWVARMKFRG